MKLLTVLLSLSLNSTLLAGSLPAKVTPTWDKQTIPGNVLTSPIAPVAIVGGEGKSVNVPHTLTVDLPEKLDAQSCYALRFRALFVRQGEPGFRHALASEVNGKELNMLTATGNFRLMNRGEYQPQSWQRGYRQTMPWFSARHYPVILAKYRPPEQAADDWEYVFDVTDLIHAGKNEITLRHAGSVGDKRCELRVRELAIVQYDPAQIQRAQAPIIRSVADKARFLSSLCPADSALRQAPTPQKWLEHIRTRTPRILTQRSSKITAKTKLNNYDKIRADGALKNLGS